MPRPGRTTALLGALLLLNACGGGGGGVSGSSAGTDGPYAADERGEGAAETMTGLKAYLGFDGNTKDRSAAANHAVATGTPSADRFGLLDGAWTLDGVTEYIALTEPALPRQPAAFTISTWVQTRAKELGTLIFAGAINDGAMWLRLNPVKGELSALSQGAFKLEIPASIADGNWHHVVMRLADGSLSLWIDGTMEGSAALTGALSLGDAPMVFGRLGEPDGPAAKDHLAGAFDDLAVFDVALTPAQITTLFGEGPARPPTANAGDDQLIYFGPAKLDGSHSTDPDGEVVEYIWDFGDGEQKKGEVVEHVFEQPGMYEVTLTVVDDEGNTATDTVLVEVVVLEDEWDPQWAQAEIDMIAEVNAYRAKGANCGGDIFGPAAPVELDVIARISARLHSLDMGQKGFFAHESLDGRSPFDRMEEAGFDGPQPWGENIAAGYPTAAEASLGLINSPGHCRNIMNPGFTVLGVGYAKVPGSPDLHYWTQNFGGGHASGHNSPSAPVDAQ